MYVSSPTLTDKVSKLICQDILTGELKPGQKLVVAELKEKYNVGASPIREALVQLSWSKYVKLAPQKGCWVAPVCKHELNDLYESLRMTASFLLKKAIMTGDENWELDVLTSYHKLSRVNLDQGFCWREWEERHYHFLEALLEGANSHNLFTFFRDILNQIKRYHYFAMQVLGTNNQGHCNIDEQEMIMKLSLSKNSDDAVQLLDRYLLKSLQCVETAIDNPL
ncbi:GntR family transcriptional regulator [Vibrio parahaemolyticus]|uniref:GntR family transcriptional regulator n=1 Tax=Vibrio parahaemolyticus TaxID=670 RepID=UPI001123F056|nr:GntR family transcriptional regulator [Vibrio parahaemolyticus]TNZ65320.1 GntR family transcriptional regulator [Vibrio parahaemolyticus]